MSESPPQTQKSTFATLPLAGDHDGASLTPIYLKIESEKIVELKNILESYDFLGLIRTLSQERGEIVVITVKDVLPELQQLLNSLQSEIGFSEIEAPASVCDDWLLAEVYPERHFLAK